MRVTTADDIKSLGTILSVWAHPDDESYLAAGLLTTAANNGQKVICVTATKGEKGIQDETRWPAERLGQIRAEELSAALDILGVKTHYYLGCKDGACKNALPEHSVLHITRIIKSESPDTILTFGPDGWTGHPDHQAVSRWTSEAVKQSGLKPKIYHVVQTPEGYEHDLKNADKKLNIFFNIDKPKLVEREDCDICFDLPNYAKETKYQALLNMPSQTAKAFKLYGKDYVYTSLACEAFLIAE